MDEIKGFVTTLVSMIILISAIELISPDNSMKKYLKFVLGTILIAVMISPIVSLLGKGEGALTNTISKYIDLADSKSNISNDENELSTSEIAFKENLEENCNRLLKEKFKDFEFISSIDCEVNMKDITYLINEVEVGVKSNEVSKIEKIIINNSDESTEVYSNEEKVENEDEIIEFLVETLSITKDKIKIHKLN
ncbi:stage III sporulation protein AF [Clostridium sp. AL.422]|uniref:stage III sporulation protein AF n=1 Tax=Clostridium TaxID=1485 RepID=UPI00293DBB88|nr:MULTISPECIES: stage III sporulation protein AF [unclassified Clostridium]MDV4152168.1 stage III sporulation protein AF [Clostridium sp. AL.422]